MKNRMMKVCALLLVLVMAVPMFAACGSKTVSQDPDKALAEAFDILGNNKGNNKLEKLLNSAAEGGSVELSMNLSNILSMVADQNIKNQIGISVKGYAGSDKIATVAKLLVDNKALVEANAFLDSTNAIISCAELLGKNAYGVKITDLVELIKGRMGGADVDIDDWDYDGPISAGTSEQYYADMMEKFAAIMAISDKLEALSEKYSDECRKIIFEVCGAERTEGNVTIGDETVKAVTFKLTLTAEKTYRILVKLYDLMSKDEEAKQTIEELVQSLGIDTENAWEEIGKDLEQMGKEEMPSKPYFEVSLVLNASKRNLMQASLYEKGEDDDDTTIILTLGVDPVSPKYSAFEIKGEENVKFEYKVDKNTSKEYSAKLSITANDQTVSADINWKNEEYTLTVTVPAAGMSGMFGGSMKVTIEGKYSCSSTKLLFSVDAIKFLGMSIEPELTLTILAKDTAPKAPEKYEDLTDPEVLGKLAEEIEKSGENLQKLIPQELIDVLEGLFVRSESFRLSQLGR